MTTRDVPLCRHFGSCGGCLHQDMSPPVYRAFKRDLIAETLAQHGFDNVRVNDVVEIGPMTRRRAVFKAARQDGVVHLGFHAARSHTIVDMKECHVLTTGFARLVPGLRSIAADLLRDGEKAEWHVTEADNGFDMSWHAKRKPDVSAVTTIARQANMLGIARVTWEGEVLVALREPEVTFSTAGIRLPPNAFLQASRQGEKALQALVMEGVGRAKHVVDLFAGLGTFAIPLAARSRVHAVDSSEPALEALRAAIRRTQKLKPLTIETRDLFKRPLSDVELRGYDTAVMDPPRAGASAQTRSLAQSRIPTIVYVSCNPQSFARDARVLAGGGYNMGVVTPIDQFLWSSHIELVAVFSRN